MITYCSVERFPERAFSRLQREVFAQTEGIRAPFHQTLRRKGLPRGIKFDPDVAKLRIGAWDEDHLVGWSIGWQLTPERFYMSNSGVVSHYQRRGIYSRLVAQMLEAAAAMGCSEVVSQHLPGNRAVLEAKAKLGFVSDGFCFPTSLAKWFGFVICLERSVARVRCSHNSRSTMTI